MILGGTVGTSLYLLISRHNGPMKATEVPHVYTPVVNDTDPVALIGYSDPIARVINDIAYEVANARLIKFEGEDAKVVPSKMIVNDIEAVTLNGVVIEDYVLTSTLVNYVPKSILNNYVMKVPF